MQIHHGVHEHTVLIPDLSRGDIRQYQVVGRTYLIGAVHRQDIQTYIRTHRQVNECQASQQISQQ